MVCDLVNRSEILNLIMVWEIHGEEENIGYIGRKKSLYGPLLFYPA